MPAYNAEKYIYSAIESVRAQTYTNWELIVVDDGSTDNTASIVNDLMHQDDRIQYVYQQNKRLSAARNTGIKQSKNSWIAFLDSDDLWATDKLEKQMQVAASSPDADIIFTSGYIFYGEDLNNLKLYPTKIGTFSGGEVYKFEYEANYIPVLSVMVKKSFIGKVGWQDETLNVCEDLDYWLRMARAGAKFIGMPEKLFYYRRHTDNMSADNLVMDYGTAIVLIKNFEKERFNTSEIRKVFKPYVNPLLVSLVNNNKQKEAFTLMERLSEKIPFFSFKLCYIFLRLFNKSSLLPIRAIKKIDTLLYRH